MAALPIRDRAGNALVDIRFIAEDELARLDPVPASLVVVVYADVVLMVFDSWRKQWELPGGECASKERPHVKRRRGNCARRPASSAST